MTEHTTTASTSTSTVDHAPDPRPAPTVWPGLSYVDAPAAIQLLTDVFGFREMLVVRGTGDGEDEPGPDDVVHAELRWPAGGGVMLGTAKYQSESHAEMRTGGSAVYVNAEADADVDAVHARVAEAGLEIVQDLHDADYGSHGFTVRDPEGNLWTFGTYRGA